LLCRRAALRRLSRPLHSIGSLALALAHGDGKSVWNMLIILAFSLGNQCRCYPKADTDVVLLVFGRVSGNSQGHGLCCPEAVVDSRLCSTKFPAYIAYVQQPAALENKFKKRILSPEGDDCARLAFRLAYKANFTICTVLPRL
jgi:hypothetical protein